MNKDKELKPPFENNSCKLQYELPAPDEHIEDEFEFNYHSPSKGPFWNFPIQFEAYVLRKPFENGIYRHTVIIITGDPFLCHPGNFQFYISCERLEYQGLSCIPFLPKLSKAQLIDFVRYLVKAFFIEYANKRIENL
ncbi:MAG: hypothetical protein HYZ14_03190 [Bacteroidetes bacterium]|nr:hypothetical protein [Bacteroidota bacterium]